MTHSLPAGSDKDRPALKSSLVTGRWSRSAFLRRAGGAAVAGLALGSVPFVRAQQRVKGDKVRLALVGIGNQGNSDRKKLVESGLCDVVALCDVDLDGKHAQEAQTEHPSAKRFRDFRKMFDSMAGEIDAVVIATPDHSHFVVTMLAMSFGKHVYVEKPLAHTFGQCARLMRLAEKSGVVTQMGNQGHSGANYFQAKAWSEAGLFKGVTRIDAHMNSKRRWHDWGAEVTEYPSAPLPPGIDWDTWMAGAPEHPFSPKLHPQEWRSWFDYGSGAFGDWGPHILDTAHRFLKLGLPTKITAVKREGANPLVFPQASTIRFDFPAREGMPACTVTWYDGVDNKPDIDPELGEMSKDPKTGETRRRPQVIKDPGRIVYGKDMVFRGGSHDSPLRVIPRDREAGIKASLPDFPRDNSNHYANFLLACLGREEARSPFSISGPLTQMFSLGVIAQRLGGSFEFDVAAGKFIGNSAADALLDPAPRAGWESFYKL